MLRIIAALAFTSAGGIMGFSMADKLKEARKICDDISSLFQRASFLIGYRCDDVYAVCRNLKADSEFKNLTFLQYLPDEYTVGEDFPILSPLTGSSCISACTSLPIEHMARVVCPLSVISQPRSFARVIKSSPAKPNAKSSPGDSGPYSLL